MRQVASEIARRNSDSLTTLISSLRTVVQIVVGDPNRGTVVCTGKVSCSNIYQYICMFVPFSPGPKAMNRPFGFLWLLGDILAPCGIASDSYMLVVWCHTVGNKSTTTSGRFSRLTLCCWRNFQPSSVTLHPYVPGYPEFTKRRIVCSIARLPNEAVK